MPASRWQTSFIDLFRWMEDADAELMLNAAPPFFSHPPKTKPPENDPAPEQSGPKYPEVLPILPLRGVVVYPFTAVPLTVGQPRSIRLVDDVVSGDKLVGLVTAINPEIETPGPTDLYRTGTIAIVHRLLRAPDGTIRLLVQGLARFRLGEFVAEEPYLKAHIELAPEIVEQGLEIDALARNARDQFRQITQMIPSFPEELEIS
ncbi:MAG: LON peptidase substrate-binding domain-containing protein, partial [Anaerolineales bacterium]|nr:LON peptidase substrate-binding domain-containing protein [Anaerolineales bacterium]